MAAKKGPFQYESTLPTINYIPLLRFRGTCVSFSGEYRGKKTARRHLDSLEEPLLNGMLNF